MHVEINIIFLFPFFWLKLSGCTLSIFARTAFSFRSIYYCVHRDDRSRLPILYEPQKRPAGITPLSFVTKKEIILVWPKRVRNVYLLVCHVPFIANGAGFLLENFVHCSKNPALSDKLHDRPTDLFFRLSTLFTHLPGSNL